MSNTSKRAAEDTNDGASGSKTIDLSNVVQVLTDDDVILENFNLIYNIFDVRKDEILPTINAVKNRTASLKELFYDVVTIWINKNADNATVSALADQMKSKGYRRLAESLEENFGSCRLIFQSEIYDGNGPLMRFFYFGLSEVVASFTGREKELTDLHSALSAAQGEHHQYIVVSGMGGVGKSSLCRSYSRRYHESYGRYVIWIDAESEQTIQASFDQLIKRLSITPETNTDGNRKTLKVLAAEVYEKFDKNLLIIFDNAEAYNVIEPCLPTQVLPIARKPAVLITSQKECLVQKPRGKPFPLGALVEKDGLQFIRDHCGCTEDESGEYKRLYDALQGHPLALQHAACYIQKTNVINEKCGDPPYTIDEYLKDLDLDLELEPLDSTPQEVASDYGKTVAATMSLSFEKVKNNPRVGKFGIASLQVAAFLNPEGMSRQVVEDIVRSIFPDGNKKLIREGTTLPSEYSLYKNLGKTITVHRLVQIILLRTDKDGTQDKVLEYFTGIDLLQKSEIDYIGHAIDAWSKVRDMSLLRKHLKLARSIMTALDDTRKWMAATAFCSKDFEIRLKQLQKAGADKKEVLDTTFALAHCLRKTVGKFPEACRLFEEVWKGYKSLLGEEHATTVDAKYNYAVSLHCTSRYAEALRIHQEVYEIQRRTLGEEDPITLKNLQKIGVAGDLLGLFQEGNAIYEQVYRIRLAQLGEDHLDTLESKHNVACSLTYLSRHEEAVQLYKEVHEKQRVLLGEDHDHTINNLHMMANSLQGLGRYEEAMEIYLQVHTVRKVVLGTRHPDTAVCIYNMGIALSELGRYEEALTANAEAYEIQREVFGEQHEFTTRAASHAILYKNQLDLKQNGTVQSPR